MEPYEVIVNQPVVIDNVSITIKFIENTRIFYKKWHDIIDISTLWMGFIYNESVKKFNNFLKYN